MTVPVTLAERAGVRVWHGDALDTYAKWDAPTCIVSDGPYGLGIYPGEPRNPRELAEFYRPHAEAWAGAATGKTTLWFWCTEVGWALTHPVLEEAGWEYVSVNVWDKGRAHIAGNVNTHTIRRFPVVTEVCAHYVRRQSFGSEDGSMTVQEWLRSEWRRTGLPMSDANAACGVDAAASRKYFASDAAWYPPPPEMFERIVAWANERGRPEGRPYFALDGLVDGAESWEEQRSLLADAWRARRPRFACPFGETNVWQHPALRGAERSRSSDGSVSHENQKPLRLVERLVVASTLAGEMVWEPFGGTGTAAVASLRSGRRCETVELIDEYASLAAERLLDEPEPLFVMEAGGEIVQDCLPGM